MAAGGQASGAGGQQWGHMSPQMRGLWDHGNLGKSILEPFGKVAAHLRRVVACNEV